MKPYRYVCTKCGSDKVFIAGLIGWDFEHQRFYVIDLCDIHFCEKCDDECRIEQKFEDEQENQNGTRP